MSMMDRLREIISRWGEPMPPAKPLPPHVQAVKIDDRLLALHIVETAKPNAKRSGFKSDEC